MLSDILNYSAILISIALVAACVLNLHEISKHILVWP